MQYASKKTYINGPFNGVPIPASTCSSSVHLIGSSVHFFAGFVLFTQFLARAKLKSKAKKTTEKPGSKNIYKGLGVRACF